MSKEQSLSELLEKINSKVMKMNPMSLDDIPDVPLYMDQLTTMMDSKLRNTLRRPTADKVLTKTMINNYAKNDLIPPPYKKKYNKDHLYELLSIFYFKNFLSISDIQTLLAPLSSEFFGKSKQNGFGLDEIYTEIVTMGKGARGRLKDDMTRIYEAIDKSFVDYPEDKKEYLRKYSFVCLLSYDIFLKKYIIEQMIDEIADDYVVDRDGSYDEELRRKAAKEATSEATRIAKLKEERAKAVEKIRVDKLKMERMVGGDKTSVFQRNTYKK